MTFPFGPCYRRLKKSKHSMLLCSPPHSLPRGLLVLEKKCTPFKGFGHRCAQTMFFDSHNNFIFEKNAFSLWRRAHPCARTIFFANPVFANHSPATMKLNFFLLLWRTGAPRAQMPQMRDNKEPTWRQHGANMVRTWTQNGAQTIPNVATTSPKTAPKMAPKYLP